MSPGSRLEPRAVAAPPSGAELPIEDGENLESEAHRLGIQILCETLGLHWKDRTDYYAGGNCFLYFSALQSKRNDFRGPDFFVVLNTERKLRHSWVVWEEDGNRPAVIIELTSPTTEREDRGRKKDVYERLLGIPEYFIFDPFTGALEGWRFRLGHGYEPIVANAAGRLAVESLSLELAAWRGPFERYEWVWPRWYLPDGTLLPTKDEWAAAEAARVRVDAERLTATAQAEAERVRVDAERLAATAQAEAERARAEAARLTEELTALRRRLGDPEPGAR